MKALDLLKASGHGDAILDGPYENLPVVGPGLRQFQQLRGQVLCSVVFDPQFFRLRGYVAGEIPQPRGREKYDPWGDGTYLLEPNGTKSNNRGRTWRS